MNTILERIRHNFSESIQTKINSADMLQPAIGMACDKILQCLLDGHKIISCGNGSSAYDALNFSAQMLHCVKNERPSLPAIALTADMSTLTGHTSDGTYSDIFAKQIRALGNPGDLLLVISANSSVGIHNAIQAAQDRGINVIALTGQDSGKIAEILQPDDVEIRVPATDSARIQETHLLIIHCICDIVDFQLFGSLEKL